MQIFETVLSVALIVYLLFYIILAFCCKKPIKTVFLIALSGIAAMILINLTGGYTGVKIPVNAYTVGLSAGAGIIGVAGFLILNLILGV